MNYLVENRQTNANNEENEKQSEILKMFRAPKSTEHHIIANGAAPKSMEIDDHI